MAAGAPRAAAVVEPARAKINLTLKVLGRRPDGYHELESLVAFADVADSITLTPAVDERPGDAARGHPFEIEAVGPFASSIMGENLIERAIALAVAEAGRVGAAPRWSGRIVLEKILPVASGIGGGSADAAAVLRALRVAFPETAAQPDCSAVAARVGADVPVCLLGRGAMMRGIGDRLEPVHVPRLPAVLVTPLVTVPADKTRRVFAALGAAELRATQPPSPTPHLRDLGDVIAFAREVGNGLEAAACSVIPDIAEVKAALTASAGCEHALLSGAGPTCVGLYADMGLAHSAARSIAAGHSGWWVAPAAIGD